MNTRYIRTAVDDTDVLKGDVVITKRTLLGSKGHLETICTHCEKLFVTTYRRMGRLGSKRALEVRNVPQCPACRHRYGAGRGMTEFIGTTGHEVTTWEGEGGK